MLGDCILVVAAVIYRVTSSGGQVAIFRRGPSQAGAGFWEFPGGKVEVGESEPEALCREIVEELNCHIKVGDYLGETTHQYPNKKIHLKFYWVEDPGGVFQLSDHDAFRWVSPAQIDKDSFSEADRAILDILKLDHRLRS